MIHSMMARFRRMASIRPVQRIKHVVDAQGTLTSPTVLPTTLVAATDTPTLAVTTTVLTGSTVNGLYLRVEVAATEVVSIPNAYLMVYKNPGGNLTFPVGNVVGSDDNKKYVIHQEMVMLQANTAGNPRTLFNGVIVIPKHLRRMGPNDLIKVDVFSPNTNLTICVQCHFKEFR